MTPGLARGRAGRRNRNQAAAILFAAAQAGSEAFTSDPGLAPVAAKHGSDAKKELKKRD